MLEINHLSKSFKLNRKQKKQQGVNEVFAVKNINLKLGTNQIVAMIGSNGAGKSTILRLLTGLLIPTVGTIKINGVNILEDLNATRAQIGFVSDNTQLYHRLTVRENLTFFAKLYKMQDSDIKQRIKELSQSMQFDDFLDKKINDCSTGMQQKTNIARALIHSPTLLILDEPTSGLDIKAAQTALKIIKAQKNENSLVLFSTHHLHEVETLADHIVAIEQGQCVFSGTPNEFTAFFKADSLYQAALNCVNNSTVN
ncbi:MAG: ABC transporter ATP-binding protein [Saccharospirillaceae bacterium]|nr:ABC transporter ATP-binding protein [Pseudomonadales bacterium]NRB77885.1 ABC transporter ATP-binding protein [Saccharospirillaceae bacterium]